MCGCAHVHTHMYLEGKPTVFKTIKEVFMLQQAEDYVCGSYVLQGMLHNAKWNFES